MEYRLGGPRGGRRRRQGAGGAVQAPPPARRLPRRTSGVAAAGQGGDLRRRGYAEAAGGVALTRRRVRGCSGGWVQSGDARPSGWFLVFFLHFLRETVGYTGSQLNLADVIRLSTLGSAFYSVIFRAERMVGCSGNKLHFVDQCQLERSKAILEI